MHARLFQLLRQPDIIFEVILGPVRIEHIAGIADDAFGYLAGLDHRVERDAHVLNPV